MCEYPPSLQKSCINCICENLSVLCRSCGDTGEMTTKITFAQPDIFLPKYVSEDILVELCEKGYLSDRVLSLFDSKVMSLSKVKIANAKNVSTRGLQTLKEQHIVDLEVNRMGVSVNDLIGCLGDWTLQNLKALNVAHSSFESNVNKFIVVVSLSKLKNLRELNVSYTDFNNHALEIITEDLPLIESLDISRTKVTNISHLRRCRQRLKTLKLFMSMNTSTMYSSLSHILEVVLELHELRYLDISVCRIEPLFEVVEKCNSENAALLTGFLTDRGNLPHLVHLDLSGREDVDIASLKTFISCRPQLRFLGLMQTDTCYDSLFVKESNPDYPHHLVVTGTANEQQLMESLRRYSCRREYVQKIFYHLFRHTQLCQKPRPEMIERILPGMRMHHQEISIQLAATACLYNLTKGDLSQKIHPELLARLVNLTLDSMTKFSTHFQLQKNSLLTLCSDRILQEVDFDRYRCARLVMDCLCAFDDSTMDRMAVAICSILAAKISTSETSLLGAKPSYMKKLLSIVAKKNNELEVDVTFKFTLSALWNLTDESPGTCEVFLSEEGMSLFLTSLERFPGEVAVETKVLGLLNNIAEVPKLRGQLYSDHFINTIRKLLQSPQIDVSYFAAGIVAHLASDGHEVWNASMLLPRDIILNELSEVVQKWENPDSEMVAYRSFQPFFPLLDCHDSSAVQLWAVWAIHHVCTKNRERYCPMLLKENGHLMIKSLLMSDSTDASVRSRCQDILALVS